MSPQAAVHHICAWWSIPSIKLPPGTSEQRAKKCEAVRAFILFLAMHSCDIMLRDRPLLNMLYIFSNLTDGEVASKRNARLGTVMSMVLYSSQPKIYKLPQSIMSAEMWRQGSSQKMVRCLNHLGLCQGNDATRSAVDKLSIGFDVEVMALKSKIEVISSNSFDFAQSHIFL